MNKAVLILCAACGFFAGVCVGMMIGRGGNSFGCNNGTTYLNRNMEDTVDEEAEG